MKKYEYNNIAFFSDIPQQPTPLVPLSCSETTVDGIAVPDISYSDVVYIIAAISNGSMVIVVSTGLSGNNVYQIINVNMDGSGLNSFELRAESARIFYSIDHDLEEVSISVAKDPAYKITAITETTDSINVTLEVV